MAIAISTVMPQPYAHKGRRRRRYTEELVRCPHGADGHRPCLALVWKSAQAMRDHLAEHWPAAEIAKLDDDQVREFYVIAKRESLEGVPDDV